VATLSFPDDLSECDGILLVTPHSMYRQADIERFVQPGTAIVDNFGAWRDRTFHAASVTTRSGVALLKTHGPTWYGPSLRRRYPPDEEIVLLPVTPGTASEWLYPLCIGCAVSLALTPAVRWTSVRLGNIDRPVGPKIHKRATPLMGGVAVYLAFATASVLVLPLTSPVRGCWPVASQLSWWELLTSF
jgi:hypothetical protein